MSSTGSETNSYAVFSRSKNLLPQKLPGSIYRCNWRSRKACEREKLKSLRTRSAPHGCLFLSFGSWRHQRWTATPIAPERMARRRLAPKESLEESSDHKAGRASEIRRKRLLTRESDLAVSASRSTSQSQAYSKMRATTSSGRALNALRTERVVERILELGGTSR